MEVTIKRYEEREVYTKATKHAKVNTIRNINTVQLEVLGSACKQWRAYTWHSGFGGTLEHIHVWL